MRWLEHQTHLRRITTNSYGKNTNSSTPSQSVKRSSGSTSIDVCGNCRSNEHNFSECPDFLKLSNNERWERVKSLRYCFLCLNSGHKSQECTESLCNLCSRPHHHTLHRSTTPVNSTPVSRDHDTLGSSQIISRSFLPVLRIQVKSRDRSKECTAVLDSGSEISIISSRFSQQLGLVGIPFDLQIVGAGGVTRTVKTKKVKINTVDNVGNIHEVQCVVLSKACGRALRLNDNLIRDCGVSKLQEKKIFTKGGEVDLLIGMSNPELHKQISMETLENRLIIMETCFGHCLVGANPTPEVAYERGEFKVNSLCIVNDDLDEEIWKNHLEAELAGISKDEELKSEDEMKFDQKMRITRVESEENRLEVSLAWKYNPETFENNRREVIECDKKLMAQLKRNETVHKLFEKQMKEMIELKVLKKVDSDYPKRYLPLLAVTDLERESTKVRICLDAKRKFNGISFNDFLLNGKLEMSDLFEVLTGFRSGDVAIQGDIEKMFWQIMLSEYDQQFHGIIFDGETYVFTRVCFGDKPSPTVADICMQVISTDEKKKYPQGSTVIKKKRFVDDLLDAAIGVKKLITKKEETTRLLGEYGFKIKEWMSNRAEIGEVKSNGKVLGLLWNAVEDVLSVKIRESPSMLKFTKRNVLRKIAEIWDPLGFLSGLMVEGKLIFQSIVRMKLGWDEVIADGELENKWERWRVELQKCDGFVVGRSLLPTKGNVEDMKFDLIGCGDGSSVGHGAAVYLRWYDDEERNIDVRFVGAKGKVNPIKGTTVPRSELSGALLVSKLAHSVENTLKDTDLMLKYKDKTLFSDSTTALSWVKSASMKFKPFVKNKVMKIQELQPVNVWRYIPSSENTGADLISKGCQFKDLEKIVAGPKMFYSPRKEWKSLNCTQRQNRAQYKLEEFFCS